MVIDRSVHSVFMRVRRWRRNAVWLVRGYLGRDSLTGLGTARQALWFLRRDLRRGKGGAVIFCDLDHLAYINLENGYMLTDELLRLVAVIFGSRTSGSLCHWRRTYRLGGDEFMIRLPGADLATAQALADDARRKVKRLPTVLEAVQADDHPLTARFAIAAWPDGQAPSYAELREAAENALRLVERDAVISISIPEPT